MDELIIDETQRDIQINKLKNWRRKNCEALAPLNGGLLKMIKEEFELHPKITELRFVLGGPTLLQKDMIL